MSMVEPESRLQTVRLRGQLEEEHRQMRLLDAKLQAIVKERCRHEGFPRLADMEDDCLEPEPDVDDMLLLPLHINEVLRVLRAAQRSPVQSDVICVPLRSAQMSVAVGEALEETTSRSSCAALSEVSLLLWQLSGKEVPEPTVAPQEGPNLKTSRDFHESTWSLWVTTEVPHNHLWQRSCREASRFTRALSKTTSIQLAVPLRSRTLGASVVQVEN
eukprot:s49_g19.t2